MNISIIGYGQIGKELHRQAEQKDWTIDCIVQRHCDDSQAYKSDACFLSIPSNQGTAAKEYIISFARKQVPVITCEKGALADHYEELEPWLGMMGYSATVGGGTGIIPYLQHMMTPKTQIHAVLNGTMNFIFDNVSTGLEAAVRKAQEKGYAEPGSTNAVDIINGEMGDVARKVTILCNVLKLGMVTTGDFTMNTVDDRQMHHLAKGNHRFIVSITHKREAEDVIGGFRHDVGNYVISAGFKEISAKPEYQSLIPNGANNAILLKEGDAVYRLEGPGAGPGPTASTMIKDALRLTQHIYTKKPLGKP